MKKILCPTDFSDAANTGVMYAAKFAKATGASLTLYHVQSMFSLTAIEFVGGRDAGFESIKSQLEVQSREVSRIFRVSCYAESETSISNLTQLLKRKEHEYDLIIMGSRGFDDLLHFFTGSTTYRTIRQCNIPLIIVPEGNVYCPVEKVVFAYNYIEEKGIPLDQLTPWIFPLQSKLTVMEVYPPGHKREGEEEYYRVQKLIRILNSEMLVAYDIIFANQIADEIHGYMLDKEADMLVLSSKHRNFVTQFFHKSIIRTITNRASYPVFIVHE